MDRGPRCSIVIPVFNGERFVADAVRSALAQTFTDREVIVVDDGSTDGTAAALEPLKSEIVYDSQPHRGVSAARNRALELARGELVAFLDADDLWPPTWLEVMVRHFDSRDDVDVVTHRIRRPPLRGFRTRRQAFWILQYNFMAYMTLVPKRLLDTHGGFDEELHAFVDWDLWIRLVSGGARVAEAPSPPGLYRRLPNSITSHHETNLRSELRMFERLVEKSPHLPVDARLRIARGKAAFADGDDDAARRHYRGAVLARGPLATSTRILALAVSLSPGLARRAYRNRALRRRQRQGRAAATRRP